MRPWNDRPIVDCREPLQPLPPSLLRLQPHPYVQAGAPYGPGSDPFRLRSGVIKRLLMAQQRLQQQHPDLQLAIFDAWRPIAVQRYMVAYAIGEECERRGLNRADPAQAPAVQAVVDDVGRFWAPPNSDPTMPPPHSTGAAVDLTLANRTPGQPLDMGGAIDAIGEISHPDHYGEAAKQHPDSEQAVWHERRELLRQVMHAAGFEQHPNEWWHFSHGDQLWAWRCGAERAIYAGAPSSAETA
ncbi:MAG: M15 family metallopeptidase [Cyanobacteriota bacterium]|nr:M15 family metallopeptidase [Cyanobacteriota bacterium]